MTEADWLACTDPWKLCSEMGWKGSHRKFRLFGVACCRSLWHLAGDDVTRNAIEVAERYADGEATSSEARSAGHFMEEEVPIDFMDHLSEDQVNLKFAAGRVCLPYDLMDNIQGVLNNLQRRNAENARFLRDIFGNPFQWVYIERTWMAPRVLTLARAIYEERSVDGMPILADALEEASCTDQEILAHCRGPGPHVRGCWVVDLLLGKT